MNLNLMMLTIAKQSFLCLVPYLLLSNLQTWVFVNAVIKEVPFTSRLFSLFPVFVFHFYIFVYQI